MNLLRHTLTSLLLALALLGAGCAVFDSAASQRVFLEVPPQVQTKPGYCAPATISRAMEYAGASVSQDHLARFTKTSPLGGVNISEFYSRLAPLFEQMHFSLHEYVKVDAARSLALAHEYNGLVAIFGGTPIAIPDENAPVYLEKLFMNCDPELLSLAAQPGVQHFEKTVQKALSRNTPLLWGVVLGIVRESPNVSFSGAGGHLRLIVGFDPASHTIFYSDSWSEGCMVKEMKSNSAWAITQSLHALSR